MKLNLVLAAVALLDATVSAVAIPDNSDLTSSHPARQYTQRDDASTSWLADLWKRRGGGGSGGRGGGGSSSSGGSESGSGSSSSSGSSSGSSSSSSSGKTGSSGSSSSSSGSRYVAHRPHPHRPLQYMRSSAPARARTQKSSTPPGLLSSLRSYRQNADISGSPCLSLS